MQKNDQAAEKRRPTRHHLREAHRRGEVAKSSDVTSAALLGGWLVSGVVVGPFAIRRLLSLFDASLDAALRPDPGVFRSIGGESFATFVLIGMAAMGPPILAGFISIFAQTGPVMAVERISFNLSRMSFAQSFARLFKVENLVRILKSLLKLAVIGAAVLVIIRHLLGQSLSVLESGPNAVIQAITDTLLLLLITALACSAAAGAADFIYQRHLFMKRMRMTPQEIRQEMRQTEGDPLIKRKRRRTHRQLALGDILDAARNAVAVVTNPTHVAIAIGYDPADQPVPVVSAKGMGPVASAIREAALEAKVPIIENVPLARGLLERVEIDEQVPEDLFFAIAEVIVWAMRMRELARQSEEISQGSPDEGSQA